MQTVPSIMFSYCWDDEDIVKPFIKDMIKTLKEKYGYNGFEPIYDIFYDKRVLGIGDKIYEKINLAIESSDVVIAFVSENYKKSINCMGELVLANEFKQKQLHKKIIPIRIGAASFGTLCFRPDELYVDFDDEKILEKILESIFKSNFDGFKKSNIFMYECFGFDEVSDSWVLVFKYTRKTQGFSLLVKKDEFGDDEINWGIQGVNIFIVESSNGTHLKNDPNNYLWKKILFLNVMLYENQKFMLFFKKESPPVNKITIMVWDSQRGSHDDFNNYDSLTLDFENKNQV